MKPLKLEMILSLLGSLFGFLAVFHKPLGLSEAWGWYAPVLVLVCVVPLLILQKRRRAARLAVGLPFTEKPPTKRRFWLLLLLIIAASLSGPLWLPFTGVALPAATLVVTSVISCGFAILVFVLSWRYWNKRSNQTLQPTAGRFDE